MRNKLTKVLILLLMVTFTLTGCSFLYVNPVKFYSAVVATVGDESITRQDLINAYNDYGYYFVYNNGMSEQEAINKTLELEIDKKLLFNYCVNTKEYTLTDEELNETWNQVFDYFDSVFESYEEEAKEKLDIIEPETNEAQEPKKNANYKVYEPYVKSANITWTDNGNGGYTYAITDNKEDEDNDYIDIDVDWSTYATVVGNKNATSYDDYIEAVWSKYVPSVTDDIYDKCEELAVKDLTYATRYVRVNGKPLSKEADDVILYEVKRKYWNNYVATMIAKLQDEYDAIPNKYSQAELLEEYVELVENSQLTHKVASEYDKAMVGESATPDSVYYHPNNNYYYVFNLLLGFNDDQQALVNRKKAEFGDDTDGYNAWLEDYALTNLRTGNTINIHDTETGEITGTTSVDYVLNYLNNNVVGSNKEKVTVFYDAICKYNTDPGMYNATAPYIDSKDNTNMVKPFNEAGVALDQAGVYGKMSGLVLTEFGYHILFYAGKVNPAVNNAALNYENRYSVTLKDLADTIVDYRTDKTMFDVIFDKVYGDYESKYTNYETQLVNLITESVSVNINKDVRDTTLKEI